MDEVTHLFRCSLATGHNMQKPYLKTLQMHGSLTTFILVTWSICIIKITSQPLCHCYGGVLQADDSIALTTSSSANPILGKQFFSKMSLPLVKQVLLHEYVQAMGLLLCYR